MSEIHRRSRRTVADCCELPRVTVRQKAVPGLYKRKPVFADPAADFDVFVADCHTFFMQPFNDFPHCQPVIFSTREENLFHPAERPRKIDGGRAGRIQIIFVFLKCSSQGSEVLRSVLPRIFLRKPGFFCQKIDCKSRENTNRRRAPHLEEVNRVPELFCRFQLNTFDSARKLRLVDDADFIHIVQQLRGFIVENCFTHKCSLFKSYTLLPHPGGRLTW